MNIDLRTGLGYDVHRLVEGRKLILGGVDVAFEKGLLGHSDADVLVHAIMDGLCGALVLGDIGKLFPDTDPQYKDISSMVLLDRVMKIVVEKGWKVNNVDSIVCCQRPKLAPYIDEMRENIASVMKVDKEKISVKATTTEGLGPVGREEGLAAFAQILLIREI